MNSSYTPWYRIGTCIILSIVILVGCASNDSSQSSSLHTTKLSESEVRMASAYVPASVQIIPSSDTEYPIPPDQLADNILQENYELIYSQTSSAFKEKVSWNAFLNTLQSFNQNVEDYNTLPTTLEQSGQLRKIWTDQQKHRLIIADFAEHHPDYPDHTILNMSVIVQ